jgi:hypothetical protein
MGGSAGFSGATSAIPCRLPSQGLTLRKALKAFRKRFKRDPRPGDSVFFDPDAPGDGPDAARSVSGDRPS